MSIGKSRDQIVHNIPICDSDLRCPICFEEFEEPKALPKCLHTICRECLEDIVNANHYCIECPICRVRSNVPRGGVDKFVTHHLMQRLVDSIPGRKERKNLKSMIQKFEENLLKYRQMLVKVQSSLHDASNNADEAAERLKTEISKHAQKVTETIQDHAVELCCEVDEIYNDVYKISEIKNYEQRLSCLLDESVASLLQAQDVLEHDLTFEIIDQLPAMRSREQGIARSVDALELYFSNLDVQSPQRFLFIKNNDIFNCENMLGWLQDENSPTDDPMLVQNDWKTSVQCRNCRKIERKRMARMRRLRRKEKCRQKVELQEFMITTIT